MFLPNILKISPSRTMAQNMSACSTNRREQQNQSYDFSIIQKKQLSHVKTYLLLIRNKLFKILPIKKNSDLSSRFKDPKSKTLCCNEKINAEKGEKNFLKHSSK